MASKKRRGKSSIKSILEEVPGRSPTGSRVRVKQEPVEPPGGEDEAGVVVKTEPRDGSGDDGDVSPGGSMSLDVLAQVASDRLEREPRRRREVSVIQRKTKIKRVGSHGMLTLDQIHALNDKLLVNLFANLESNELTRNFTYTCWLVPNCQQTFSSFGNETKSKAQVKAHLRQHIATLRAETEEDGPGKQPFSAEPLPSLKKRVQADITRSRRGRQPKTPNSGRRADLTTVINSTRRYSEPPQTFTTIKPMWASDVNEAMASLEEAAVDPAPAPATPRRKSTKRVIIPSKRNVAAKKLLRRSMYQKVTGVLTVKPEAGVDSFDTDIDVESVSSASQQVATEAETIEDQPEMDESDRARRESEMLIIEWLQQGQPYHDHGYTSIFGQYWNNGQEAGEAPEEEEVSSRTSALKYSKHRATAEREGAKAVMLKLGLATMDSANTIHIPVIKLARVPPTPLLDDLGLPLSPTTPTVMGEEVVVEGPGERETFLGQSSRRYPPMPKCELARRGRLHIPEEEEEESYVGSDEEGGRKRWISASDSDRKMALKCIRELRSKKKDGVPLVCKICKSKMFTATATLMYHYRSHAGIKPFVCLICSETFTRQHSLNYHMLIHNNQNRFTCKDCGRKFRHPSHFKEHLRRHTGETPFSCTDCPLRFKTRNTYKRHLKTRHGKLLTAHGICTLPYEEYMKIRTRPYAQTRAPEDDEDDEDATGEDNSNDDLTPFSCTDCPLHFKTRNTYKRHLKTQHSKLLTAHGICTLPCDEYMKIDDDDEDATGEDISNDDLSPSAASSPSAESSVTSIATPASNKLLQLCSQAVSDNS